MRYLRYLVLVLLFVLGAGLVYDAKGYFDALSDAAMLAERADGLIASGRGGADLGDARRAQLLMVEDPNFEEHGGVDLLTPGAGITTITQSLAKRVAFAEFKQGVRKIRQTGYALGLEQRLSKAQILALWLDTLEIGAGPDGWMTGFFAASDTMFQKAPADLSDREFLLLVAVLIAPGRYDMRAPSGELLERMARIERLIAGQCAPRGNGDVWLEGCA